MSDCDNSDILSDISSSDDDLELMLNESKIKNENYLEQTVPQYSEEAFFEHFRLSRGVVENISERFEASDYYNHQPGQHGNISPLHQVLIFLWYIGHQTSSFRDIADRFNITISSVNRILKRVTLYMSNLSPEIIKWPDEHERQISEQHFRNNGFPNAICAIEGSHIKIDKPENDPDSYINRKGYYSIQMQAICNHDRKIIDLFLGYPGYVHDSRVFNNSPLKNTLEEKCGRFFLLGDSGYPLQRNLLTPYKDRGHLTRRQQNFNIKLARNRYVIEHCFGIFKQKFRQLYHVKLRNIGFIVHLMRAACVLHNIALNDDFDVNYDQQMIQNNMDIPEPDNQNEDEEDDEDVGIAAVRDRVANNLPL